MPENTAPLPDFTRWPSFPFEGDMRVKRLAPPVEVEPPRSGEDASDCVACNTPDDAYIWVSERWRVRAMDRPTGLPMVLILECRSHLDMGDLPNLLAAELGVMTVRLERAIRSLDGVARVHVNRWGDGSAHLHMWFLARPYGRLQLRGTFLSLWDDILPVISEQQWRENLALVAAWLAEFGGNANAEPAHIQWQSPSRLVDAPVASTDDPADDRPTSLGDIEGSNADSGSDAPMIANAGTQDLAGSSERADAVYTGRMAVQDQGPDLSGTPKTADADPAAGPAADPPAVSPDDSATTDSGATDDSGTTGSGATGSAATGSAATDGSGGTDDVGATDDLGATGKPARPTLITQRNGDESDGRAGMPGNEVDAPAAPDEPEPDADAADAARQTEPSARP